MTKELLEKITEEDMHFINVVAKNLKSINCLL